MTLTIAITIVLVAGINMFIGFLLGAHGMKRKMDLDRWADIQVGCFQYDGRKYNIRGDWLGDKS